MIKRIGFTVLAALALLLVGCRGPENIWPDLHDAAKRAAAALHGALDHSLDSMLVFAPLQVEAQKAVQDLDAKTIGKDRERALFYDAAGCLKTIEEIRDAAKVGMAGDFRSLSGTCIKDFTKKWIGE